MKKTPHLLVLAYHEESLKAVIDHLHEIGLSNHCKISGTTVEQINMDHKADLILATNKAVYQMCQHSINEKIPYILARRSINFSKIKGLLSLPQNSRVYLVTNMKEAAEEAINTLLEVGIIHDYVPYYGQREVDSSILTAVTPGERDLVPVTVRKTIDIGHRLLDMSTLFEVYDFFGISTFNPDNQLTARYIQSTISLTKELNKEILQSHGLFNSLEGIVNHVEEGIIVYDQLNKIISINTQALLFLGFDHDNLIQKDISNLPSQFYEAFMQIEMERENFIDINNIPFYIRKKRIFVGTKVFATIIIFEKIDRIKNIETNYRRITQQKSFIAKHDFSDIKTNSPHMIKLINQAKKMANSNSTILIYGETGTGKEVMAQAIHSASQRKDEPFVAVNLAAIAESLVESELFGYEKGAFTGAKQEGSIGLFERAHNGTIFLDEIGDASPVIQNRLLRVLQEREIQRVGGGHPIPVDIRVIAATNKDLGELIRKNKFREDLFYRLNILPLKLVPLRKRKEDILLLSEIFCKEFEERLQSESITFSKDTINVMLTYQWPGNVRELRNTIEYLSHVGTNPIHPNELPFYSNTLKLEDNITNEQKIANTLKDKGFLQDCFYILLILSQQEGGLGRNRLLSLLLEQNKHLTEQQLRYRLELLSEMKLINVGQGRKGSSINENGKTFLTYLNQNYITTGVD